LTKMLTTVLLFSTNDCCINERCPWCNAPIVGETNSRIWGLNRFQRFY
jgi:hypothetical protein